MEGGEYPRLNTQTDTHLEELDFDQLRQERFDRNRHFLEGVDAAVAHKVLPYVKDEEKLLHPREFAAVTIQRHWRGYKGRQIYVTKLFEQYEQGEVERAEHVRQQVEEGDLLVENHQLEVILDDGITTRRNAKRRYLFKVIIIQRAWRSYLDRQRNQGANSTPSNFNDKRLLPSNANLATQSTHQRSRSNNSSETANCDTVSGTIECMINPLTENEILSSERNAAIIEDIEAESLKSTSKQSNVELSPQQQRKIYLLSQAHKFAELKKLDAKVLPFNLHVHLNQGEQSDPQQRETMSEDMSPLQDKSTSNSLARTDNNNDVKSLHKPLSNLVNPEIKVSDQSPEHKKSKGGNSGCESVCDSKGDSAKTDDEMKCEKCGNVLNTKGHYCTKCENVCDRTKGDNFDTAGDDSESAFDVYNIETALPDMDWKSLEAKLKAASEEAQKIQKARRNDREEIRKKLAMGGDDDSYDDNDDEDDITYKKPNLQSRLHSGLQICFMNESPGDTDNEGLSPRQQEIHDNTKLMLKDDNLVDSDNNLSTVEDLNNPSLPSTSTHCTSPPRLKADDNASGGDFQTRQEKLQNEAKLALAQAGTMAHMQLEIEKQTKKKSPIAEMAGIPGLGERRRKKLSPRQLQQMNLAQTQVLYNDLQTQIENLNEELVHLLMERDELHMEQDSMLVDIEDLTRHAEELADKANRDSRTKTCSIKGKLPSR